MQSSSGKHQGVKAIHLNRDRIKERIQEKHRQQRQQVRQGRLSGLRDDESDANASGPESAQQPSIGPSPLVLGSAGLATSSSPLCYNADGTLLMPVVQDWSDIGHEFGVNIQDTDVMEYLLALEEEIRQEQLFQFYDQVNGNEWEEYFHSLTS